MNVGDEPLPAAVMVRLSDEDRAIYEGEAIYRPAKPHPQTGLAVPQIGIPDDAMAGRPRAAGRMRLTIGGEEAEVVAVYLERVSTCWWFVLA